MSKLLFYFSLFLVCFPLSLQWLYAPQGCPPPSLRTTALRCDSSLNLALCTLTHWDGFLEQLNCIKAMNHKICQSFF